MGNVSLILKDSPDQINKKIARSLAVEMNKALDRTANQIVIPVRNLIRESILNQREIKSLVNRGRLAAELGLPDGDRRIEDIISVWANNIIVTKKKAKIVGNKISAGLTIKMIRSDYEDVLNLESSILRTENGDILPWLHWLLMFGDSVIIRDYEITYDFKNKYRSRTGDALMVKGPNGWKVPPQFSGNLTDNFVIRALDNIEIPLTKIIFQGLKRAV